MVLVTLIGEKQAVDGYDFVYVGSLSECRDCRLKSVCFNLEEGKRYKITRVREVHHDCKVHEDGVRVVEVEKSQIPVAIDAKLAIEGSTITFKDPECKNLGCKYYQLCYPMGLKPGNKCKVVKLKKDIDCPEKRKKKEVLTE